MSRMRVGLGLAMVAVGSAWFAGGSHAMRASGDTVVRLAPYVIALSGILLLLRIIAPAGTLLGPLLLVLAGLLWLLARRGSFHNGIFDLDRVLPLTLVMAGIVMSLSRRFTYMVATGIVRINTVLIPVKRPLSGQPPRRLSVGAILAPVTVDLTYTTLPDSGMEIDLTIVSGRITLVLPREWPPLVPGRLAHAHGLRLEGNLDAEERSKNAEERATELVLSIIGLGGAVQIERRTTIPAEPASYRLDARTEGRNASS